MNVYVGTSGFSFPEWKGSFYPAKLPAKQMLGFYSERFPTVEINQSFRILPTKSVLQGWADQVPQKFRFAIKAPQRITHNRRLANADELVTSLFETVGTLKERLGPLLFQLPPNFKKDVPRLAAFLAMLPPGSRAAVEFRHASWFDDDVFGVLRDHQAALCIADADADADDEDDLEVPFVATADWGYLRLRRDAYDDSALKAWAAQIQAQAWGDCFVFFKHEDTGRGPQMGSQLLTLLAENPRPKARRKRAR